MNTAAKAGHLRWLVGYGLLLALALVSITAAEQKQVSQGGKSRQGKSAVREEEDTALRREEWFYGQRAFPREQIPPGARQAALREMEDMMVQEGKLVRRPDGSLQQLIQPVTTMWTAIGPNPTVGLAPPFGFGNTSGRVTAVAVDPNNSNNIFLGGAEGGVWRSMDNGANWTPLTDTQKSLAIGSIAIDPANSTIVFVGTGEENFAIDSYYGAGILKLTNALDPIPANVFITQIPGPFVGPFSPTTGAARIGSLAINPTNSQIMLAGVQVLSTGSAAGLYCSNDAGATWQVVPVVSGAPGTEVVYDPGGTTAYAALGRVSGNAANGVYKSTNANLACAAQTWIAANGTNPNLLPTGTTTGRIELAIAPSSPSTLYASIQDPAPSTFGALLGFFKTTDGGANWMKLTNTPDYCNAQCWYDNTVRVLPTNANIVFVGGSARSVGWLFRSTDGGNTWTDVSGAPGVLLHVDQHALGFAKDGSRLIAGNDGGVWRLDNPGGTITFTNLNNTLNITQFYPGHSIHPADDQVGFGGTQDNGSEIYLGSLAWLDTLACGDGGWTAFDPFVPSTVYVTCQNIDVEKSVQNGAPGSFLFVSGGITPEASAFIPPFVADPSTQNRFYFGTFRPWQTNDGAATWAPISGNVTGGGVLSTIAVAPSNSAVVYVGSSSGHVQVSMNVSAGSAAFSDVSTGLPTRAVTQIVVDPTNPQVAFVTFSGFNFGSDALGHVFKTVNGGAAWVPISGNLPNIPVNDLVIDPDDSTRNTLYIATDIGVFQTSDGGVTWTTLNPGASLPNVVVLSLKLREASRTLRAATHGRGVWDLKLPNLAGTPTFVLGTIQPHTVVAGSATFTLTLNGTGFTPASVVQWNGSTMGVTTNSGGTSTQLTASINASLVAGASTAKVTVTDTGQTTNSLPFSTVNPSPIVNSVSPPTAAAGSPAMNVTVAGSGFTNGSTVTWNDTPLTTTFVSGTQLQANVPQSLLAFGAIVFVNVVNPTPGGGPAPNPVQFNVTQTTPPPNDMFANAINVTSGNFSSTVDSFAATTELTDPTPGCAPQSVNPRTKTVWYKLTVGGTGSVTADTIGSPYDTILSVWTGGPGSFTNVACNDDISLGVVIQSSVTFNVTSGTTYFLMVSAFGTPPDPANVGLGGKTVFNLTTTVPIGGGADFSVASPTAPQTVNAGLPAIYTISVAAQNGTFGNAVTLSCGPLPQGANCSFSQNPVTPGSGSQNSTLTLSTTARSFLPPAPLGGRRPIVMPLLTLLALALAAMAFAARTSRQRRWVLYLPLLVLLLVIATQVIGCGGNSSNAPPAPNGTPAGTYNVSVTGSSGGTQHSTTISLMVN